MSEEVKGSSSESFVKDVPVKSTEVSRNFDNFLQDLTDHYNKRQEWMSPNNPIRKTVEQMKAHSQMKEFLSHGQPGDVLEHWVWNAGFLAYAEGYKIVRDGKDYASTTTCVS